MTRQLRLWAALAALAATPAVALADSDISALVRDAIGLPMKVEDATSGPWALRTRNQTVCTVSFSSERGPNGIYGASIPPECSPVIPSGVVGWKPVTDGLGLVGADGTILLDFNQWTPRDLVARRAGAPYLELIRPKT